MSHLNLESWDLKLAPLPRWGRWLVRGLMLLAALALLAQFLVYAHYAVSLFRFPFDYDQGEGFELYDTVLHAQGQWPYRDSQAFPFYTSIYPPVFHLLTVPLVWAFGPQLWTGRAVGFAASLIAAGAIGWGVHRATRHKLIAVFSALTFLASNYTFHIGPLFRQHMTMVMFETLAVVTVAQLKDDARWTRQRAFWLALVFVLLAGYSKQLALATAAAVLAFLFLRGPRRAVLAGLGLSAVAGAAFLLINWATQGWWFISIIRANINAFDWAQAVSLYRQWISLHALIALAAAARLIYEIYFSRLSAYAVWFALAVGNGILAGKFGAGESYFVTATAATCILSGIALARWWERAQRGQRAWAIAVALIIPLLYLAQTRLTLHTYTEGPIYGPVARLLNVSSETGYYDSQGYTQLGPRPTRADHDAGFEIADRARAAPGPVFSEEAAFMFAAGKPVVTNPFPQLVMYQAGLFDPTAEIAMIKDKAFGLVILRAQFYPPPVLQAIGENYQPMADIVMNHFTYHLLEPRP